MEWIDAEDCVFITIPLAHRTLTKMHIHRFRIDGSFVFIQYKSTTVFDAIPITELNGIISWTFNNPSGE